ncbi:nuclear transport factor 2 family protein [Streptomyces sp. NPDC050145]|uniref:nuclear transport factor 2 family protein n=1 Tax=Streptomyces sp. NPDC050145 TaxID=3365602 RepID=UPI003789575A
MDRIGRPLLLAALALTLVAGAFAAWAGWSWYGAAHDDTAAYATARDDALEAGEQAVQNLNTLDHKNLAHGLDLWESSTTGELHTQLAGGRSGFEKQVREARTVSTAKVLDGALTELDERAGRARVMVALRVTVTASGGKSSQKDSRMLGELTRTDGHWKLSALGQAPVGDSATTD